ncbi:MAG: hypothetical protein LYZ70_07045 [Nitrososphaerales archaeon]|nr:hypothetical protein [Nitrososphaerales archaeon]
MGATVYYTKQVRGRLWPKAARTGAYAYANEVSREQGRVQFYNRLTDSEYSYFMTKPKEVGAPSPSPSP